MAWAKPLLASLLVAALATSGCIASVNGMLHGEGDLVVDMVTAGPSHVQNVNASYVDDFSKLTVLVKTFTIRPADHTQIRQFSPGVVVDLVQLAANGPSKLLDGKVPSKAYDRWGAIVYVQDAVLRNGTHVTVDTPTDHFFYVLYGVKSVTNGNRSYGNPVKVPAGGALTYHFGLAVLKDSSGVYFLRTRGDLSGPAT